jgi:plastocyanin
MRALLILAGLLLSGEPAFGADLSVIVKNAAGQPVQDAVVTLTPASGVGKAPVKFDGPMRMSQHDLQFDPFVLIVPVGADVAFPNLDKVRHHVYSFSPAKRFELKLYSHDATRSVHFDKPGVVALGCNIHDAMAAFIDVVDTPYAGKTGPDGEVTIHDAPSGQAMLQVWQPYLRAAGNSVSRSITVPADGVGRAAVQVDVRPPPPMTMK